MKAFITGATGHDGSYLAEFLLAKDYELHGVKHCMSLFNTYRIHPIHEGPEVKHGHFVLHHGDLTDCPLIQIIEDVTPTRSTTSQRRATSRFRSRSRNTQRTPTLSARCGDHLAN